MQRGNLILRKSKNRVSVMKIESILIRDILLIDFKKVSNRLRAKELMR